MATTPTLGSATLPTPPTHSKPEKKATTPRIDVEPLYNAVKSAISDADWATYKTTINDFLLGNRNQEEITRVLDRILSTPALEHAHNQLILAIFANAFRDPPEPGVVSWADDKVSGSGAKGGIGKTSAQGDGAEAEKRLKGEIMSLPRRERKRLKALDKSEYDEFAAEMRDVGEARRIHAPDVSGGLASAGGFQKTNWDLEIRKRYNAPLCTETHEFPDATSIASRMLPICYEEGLPSGHNSECPTFMNIATETYVKEMLTNIFARVSCNGPDYKVKTGKFKRECEREERLIEKGELTRTAAGLLPCEAEEMRKRPPITMEDLQMCVQLGDSFMAQTPIISAEILNTRCLDAPGVEELEQERYRSPKKAMAQPALTNGISIPSKPASNGDQIKANGLRYFLDLHEPEPVIDDEWTWQGGVVEDTETLDAVLDSCLAIGT